MYRFSDFQLGPKPLPNSGASLQGNIGLLYRAQDLQPYHNREFLCRTFNFKTEYIESFCAQSHDIKLKFYLLLEEARLSGEMKDKVSYQQILNKIALGVKILKGKTQQTQSKPQTMEDKINKLCEFEFKKQGISDKLNNGSQKNQINQEQSFGDYQAQQSKELSFQKSARQQQSWEWNQTHQQLNSQIQEQRVIPTFDQLYSRQKTHIEPIEQNFAFMQYNGKEQAYKMNVFDIQLEQENNQTKQSLDHAFESFNILNSLKVNIIPHQINKQNEQKDQKDNKTDFIEQQDKQNKENEFGDFYGIKEMSPEENSAVKINFDKIYQNKMEELNTSQKRKISNICQQYLFQLQQQKKANGRCSSFNSKQIKFIETPERLQDSMVQQPNGFLFEINDLQMLQSNLVQNKPNGFESNATKVSQNSDILLQLNSNPIYLDSKKQDKIIQIQEFELNNSQIMYDNQQEKKKNMQEPNLDDENLLEKTQDKKIFFESEPNQMNQTLPQLSLNINRISSSTYFQQNDKIPLKSVFTPRSTTNINNDVDHPLIKTLILKFDLTPIKLKIKQASFECDIEFYQNLIKWLEDLQYQDSQPYMHLVNQLKIIHEIKELTEMYTKQVEEDDQEKVAEALKKTKKLYCLLQPEKTKNVVEIFLQKNNKTLTYQLAQFVLNSGISIQHIEKILPNNSRQNEKFATSLITLYIINILGITQLVITYINNLTAYILEEYEKYRQRSESLSKMRSQDRQQIVNCDKYKQYIKGLGLMGIICKRMICIMKICSKNTGNNLVKVLRACKELQNEASLNGQKLPILWERSQNQCLIPIFYIRTIQKCLKSNQSKTKIQQIFKEKIQLSHPLCKLCLGTQQVKRYTRDQKDIMIHTQCWNLYNEVNRNIE